MGNDFYLLLFTFLSPLWSSGIILNMAFVSALNTYEMPLN